MTIVAAEHGWTAQQFEADTRASVFTEPVLAWLITEDGDVRPIGLEGIISLPCSRASQDSKTAMDHVLVSPAGQVHAPYYGDFPNVAAWVASRLRVHGLTESDFDTEDTGPIPG